MIGIYSHLEFTIIMNAQSSPRFFAPFQVAAASAFGTLFAGFMCIALNYKAAQNPKAYFVVLLLSVIITPLYLAAFALIPDTPVDRLWPIGSGLLGYGIAKFQQRNLLNVATASGVVRRSMWSMWGVVLFSLVVVFAVLLSAVMLFDWQLG